MAKNVENENKVVNFEEATAAKKRGGRRKTNPLDDAPVAENKEVNIEEEMNAPAKVTFPELIDAIKDMPTFKDVAMYMVNNHIVEKNYVDYQEVYAAAITAVRESQYANDKFERNIPLLTVYTTVSTFYLFTGMDFGDMSITQVYDSISKYNLIHAIEGIAGTTFGSGNVLKYAMAILDDIDYNERSIPALLLQLVDALGASISEQSTQELTKTVVDELVEKAKER